MHRARATLLVVLDGAGSEGRTFREFWLVDARAGGSAARGADAVDLDDEGRPAETPTHPSDWIEAEPRGASEGRRTPSAGDRVLVTDGPVAEILAQEFLGEFEGAVALAERQRALDALRAGARNGWTSDRRAAIAEAQLDLNRALRSSRFHAPVVLTLLGSREASLARDFRSLDLERGVLVEAAHGGVAAHRSLA